MPSTLLSTLNLSTLNHRHVICSISTNSELIDAIKNSTLPADKAHLLTADTQTAGRGQRGRSWQSPHGNVYLSLYHPITMPISGLLSLIIGVQLAKMPIIQTVNEQLHAQNLTPIGVKWANDLGFYNPITDPLNHHKTPATTVVYFNKLAGILIEPVWQGGSLMGVVMGVGLNVQTTPMLTTQTLEGMSYQALSLQDIQGLLAKNTLTDTPINLPSLTELYSQISQALLDAISCFEHISQQLISQQHISHQQTASDTFMQQFKCVDALSGLRVQVTQNHKNNHGTSEVITGHACGIDTNGCLQLRQDNGKLATLFTGRIDVISTL